MNMFALAQLGPVLESALGRVRFLALYLLSALGGSTLSFLVAAFATQRAQFGVGASGAIFGLFGAYYVVVRRLGGETRSILTLLAINLVITFAIPIIDGGRTSAGWSPASSSPLALAYAPRGPEPRPAAGASPAPAARCSCWSRSSRSGGWPPGR